MTTAAQTLAQASGIVTGSRADQYGGAERSFEDIAAHWTWRLGDRITAPLTAFDVAQMMIGLKQARLKSNANHFDSILDQCGYAALSAEVQETQA